MALHFDSTLHSQFEVQVEKTPDEIAVSHLGESLTYRELNEAANQLAHHLRKRGVGPETLVGLCLERSQEAVVAILGTAGRALLPGTLSRTPRLATRCGRIWRSTDTRRGRPPSVARPAPSRYHRSDRPTRADALARPRSRDRRR